MSEYSKSEKITSILSRLADSVNYPACGYNNLTGRKTFARIVKMTMTDQDEN